MAQPNLSIIQGKKTINGDSYFFQNDIQRNNDSANFLSPSAQTPLKQNFVMDENALLKLSNRLHSHLEMSDLIASFKTEIKDLLSLDDLLYQLPKDNTTINNKGRHYLSYNLTYNTINIGEVFFIRRKRFIDEEAQILEKFLIALLPSLYNAFQYNELFQQAQTDPLTGTLNRLGLEKSFSREMDLAKRNNSDLSLLMFDVDHFKKVNDSYGHDTGDQVLKDMTQHINNCIRTTDVFARFGGEEFVVLLNNTNRSGALLLAEKIRQHIENTPSYIDGKEIRYTSSIGVTSLTKRDDKESLFKRADKALYQAKNNGRNRVVLK